MTQSKLIYSDQVSANDYNQRYRNIANPDCPNCFGAGWNFEEYLLKCIFFYPGFRFSHFDDYQFATTGENTLTVYINTSDYWDKIKVNDIFFNVRCDVKGNIIHPIQRYRKWIVNDVFEMRLDSNKVEWMKVYAKPMVI